MEHCDLNNSKIVFVGAGNVATHLSLAMQVAGFSVIQVFSRSINSVQSLANQLKCCYTTDIKAIKTDADVYFFSIPSASASSIMLSDILVINPLRPPFV